MWCKDEAPQGENPIPQPQLNDTTIIYGIWKHIEHYHFDIVSVGWILSPVEDGIEYTFKRDGFFKVPDLLFFRKNASLTISKFLNHRNSSVSSKLISMTYSCLKKDVSERYLNILNEYDRLLKSDIGGYNTGDLNLYTLIHENHILFNSIYI